MNVQVRFKHNEISLTNVGPQSSFYEYTQLNRPDVVD